MRLHFRVNEQDRILELEGDVVRIGRGPDNDVVLPDFSVSRKHALLRSENGGWSIVDLDSTNGVQVNGAVVREQRVRAGDSIRIGIFDLEAEGESVSRSGSLSAVDSLPNATIVRRREDFQPGLVEAATAQVEAEVESAEEEPAALDERHYAYYLTRLARELLRSDSLDDLLRGVMEVAFEALPVDRGFILLGPTGNAVCALAREGERVLIRPEGTVPVSQTILDAVMKEEVALLTVDALDDQRLAGGESIRIHGIRAAMCAPLWSEEGISGFIQVDTPFQSGTFTGEHLDFLIALANYAAVATERVRERRLRGRLERYHSPAVVDEVLRGEAGSEPQVRLRRADVTVLFADLVGFTAFSESADPAEVAALLAGYCNRAVEVIFELGGTLDKFIGDCVMAFFGAPVEQSDHAARGVLAGIGIQEAMEEWNRERREAGESEVFCRVAINTGPVVVGDVGSDTRVDYTVLGNPVNVAARLEAYVAGPGEIVLGATTREQMGDVCEVEELGEQELEGLQQKIEAYRVKR